MTWMHFGFDRPHLLWLLLLAIPVVWLGMRSLATLDPVRRWTAIVLRLAVLVIVVLMLAGLQSMQRQTDLTVGAIVNTSESVRRFARPPVPLDADQPVNGDVQAWIDQWLTRAAGDQQADDRFFHLTYDGRVVVRSLPSIGINLDRSAQVTPSDGTDTAAAIRQAMALLPPDSAARLVLFSDGNDTRGDVLAAAREAAANNIAIDVMPLPYSVEREVLVEALYAPTEAREGQSASLRAVLRATQPTTGRLYFQTDDMGETDRIAVPVAIDDWVEEVELDDDEATLGGRYVAVKSIDMPLIYAGAHQFQAEFVADNPEHDTIAANNRAEAFTLVSGRGRLLFVDGLGGESGGILPDALVQRGLELDVVDANQIPRTIAQMQRFDAIIFQNIPAMAMSSGQQSALARYVNDLGGGFVMLGGENSFGAGNWTNTPVDRILPVECQIPSQTILPSGALVIVIDRSGSMSAPVGGTNQNRQQVANEAAVLALQALYPQDLVGVVVFDSQADWVVDLQPAADQARIAQRIRSIRPRGGTHIYPGMEEAYRALAPLSPEDAAIKHVIVLTDGMDNPGRGGNYPELVGRMVRAGISVSTVGIGSTHEIDGRLLRNIANMGDGTFYHITDPRHLPQIFTKEAQTLRKNLIKEQEFEPQLISTGSPIMSGIGSVPPLRGLVLTGEKYDPRVFMPMLGPEGEPVFAHWQVGLGRSAAFTSDATNRWATEWLQWGGYSDFWSRVVRNVARPAPSREVDMTTSIEGDRMTIRIDAGGVEPQRGTRRTRGTSGGFLDVQGVAIRPDGTEEAVTFEQVGPGIYEAHASAAEPGNYILSTAVIDPDGERRLVFGGISRPPSEELRRFRTNLLALQQIAEITGGQLLDPYNPQPAGLFDRRGQIFESRSIRPVWRQLLPWLLLLFLLDVACRRIAWEWSAIREAVSNRVGAILGALSPKPAEAEATLGALKTQRARTAARLANQANAQAMPIASPPATAAPRQRKFEAAQDFEASEDFTQAVGGASATTTSTLTAPRKTSTGTTAAEEGEQSTSSRLLSAKRRAREQLEEDEPNKPPPAGN